MRNRIRMFILSLCSVGLLLVTAAPATGGHSDDEHSRNMGLMSTIERSSEQVQSDLAFQGNLAFAGNYNGFRIIDISSPAKPTVLADVWCPGPQNDISVWDDVIILSVDTVMASDECGAEPLDDRTDPTGWEGLRIFSLDDVLATEPDGDGFVRPQPVSTVYTDCGSHTHTGVPDGDRVLAYVSSYPLRSGPTCGPENAEELGYDPLHSQISIVEVPLATPEDSEVLRTVPIDVPTWDTLEPHGFNPMQGCHDIQVDMQTMLAAAACTSVGQVWDISDPENPATLAPLWEVNEPEVEFYHSALFSEDRDVIIFGDESILRTCDDGSGSGQLWFHDRTTGDLHSSFQIDDEIGMYCSAHLFNNIPTDKGNYMVASWYNGGVRVIDYNDPTEPEQIGSYRPAPTDDPVRDEPVGHWSAYWYNGWIYANDMDRGFDIFRLADPARAGAKKLPALNPQTQE
ncbi:hypothetical protein F8178_05130 [Haloechinothrix sp. LS1_15]|nr:hypothetical protein [Haloechinothrix sp. LS1_15]